MKILLEVNILLDLYLWMKGWGFCTWIGFLIVVGVLSIFVHRWLKIIFGPDESSYYCPRCGYNSLKDELGEKK